MKKIYTIVISIILSVSVFAQAPQKISYQAIIRDASNNLVTNKTVGLQISILKGSATGTEVYSETQTPSTNANGLISIEFGGSTTFNSIDWGTDTYFIKTETDPAGGSNYTITGTSQLLSVPFALYAKSAGNGFSGKYDDLKNKPNLSDTSKYLKAEVDPMFNVSVAKGISMQDTAKWNAKSNFSGVYSNLIGKPNIPTKTSELTNDAGFVTPTTGGVPAGTVLPFTGINAPAGYLLCDGSAISRMTYSDLFSTMGSAYGAGDGTTTFNLPDLRGRFLRGVDGTAGNDPDNSTRIASNIGGNTGNAIGSLQSDTLKSHKHNFIVSGGSGNSTSPNYVYTYLSGSNNGGGLWNAGGGTVLTAPIQSTGGSETRPVNIYINYIIKY